MAKDKDGLTIKQKAFCLEYHKSGNAMESAINSGYSKKTAGEQGYQLLQKTSIQNFLASLSAKLEKKFELSSEKIINELSLSGFFDPINIFDIESGCVKSIKDITEAARRAIASIEVQETFEFVDGKKEWNGYIKKIRFWDKIKSNELLGKHLGMFADTHIIKIEEAQQSVQVLLNKILDQINLFIVDQDLNKRLRAAIGKEIEAFLK
jgi:phage terminase small subunit